MKKPPSILDKDFVYIPSTSTNLRKTFARIRREMKKDQGQPHLQVVPLKREQK